MYIGKTIATVPHVKERTPEPFNGLQRTQHTMNGLVVSVVPITIV
jgi:hypothetical protein